MSTLLASRRPCRSSSFQRSSKSPAEPGLGRRVAGPNQLTAGGTEQMANGWGDGGMDGVADPGAVILVPLHRDERVSDAVADHRRLAEQLDRVDRRRDLAAIGGDRGILG